MECGVWKGGMIMCAMDIQKMYNQNRKFYLYDTYDGMTEPKSEKDLQEDKNKFKNKGGNWHKITIDEVKSNIKLCN